MGKKKGAEGPKVKKVAVDKTFGMKNKKGAAVQKQIKAGGLNHQQNQQQAQKEKSQAEKKKLKQLKEEEAKFLLSLGYQAPDKKKGKKKSEKQEETEEDASENPDGVVDAEAADDDGEVSKGRRVLAREARELEAANSLTVVDKGEQISLEVLIEEKRAKLRDTVESGGRHLTPVNEETFKAWKRKKLMEKKAAFRKEQKKLKKTLESGVVSGVSGRALFTMGHAKDSDVGGDGGGGGDKGGDDGDFDLTTLRGETEAAEKARHAAEDEKNDDEEEEENPAKKMFATAKKIDESLFAMDLGDIPSDEEDDDDDDEEEEAATDDKKSEVKVTVDTALFDASLLDDMGDLDDLDD